jgi:V-type H+-transporting ATPase proteolipid subunit
MNIYIAGIAIGITGDAGVRATAQQPRMFVGMVSVYKGGDVSLFLNYVVDLDLDFR